MTRAELIQYITDNVYPNARNEVTAPMVRDSLLEIVDFLGDAATYNIGMVASGNQGLVTGGNVNTAIALALLPYYTAAETGQAIDDAIARIGLGQAAYKDLGQVADGNTGLVMGGQVYSAINAAITSAIKFQGVSDTPLTDGSTTNPIQIDGQLYAAKKGDMVVYGGNEYLWVGNKWQQMGDESSYALKTIQITGTGYLTGGGDLTQNRTLDISATAKAYIDHGEAAYNYFPGGVLGSTHLPSMYIGTTSVQFTAAAQNLTGVSSVRATNDISTLFEWDVTNSAWHFHGNIYTDGWFSGGGISPGGGGGGGGIDPVAMWRLLTNDPSLTQYDNYTKISADHINFPVTSVVGLTGGITAQQIAQALNLGSFAYKNSLSASDIPDLSGTYLPLAGGTMTGPITFNYGDTTSQSYSTTCDQLTRFNGLLHLNVRSNKLVISKMGTNGLVLDISAIASGVNTQQFQAKDGTIALTSSNVASATKLQTARTIWGQKFDGTANLTGSLTDVENITANGRAIFYGDAPTQDVPIYIGSNSIGFNRNSDRGSLLVSGKYGGQISVSVTTGNMEFATTGPSGDSYVINAYLYQGGTFWVRTGIYTDGWFSGGGVASSSDRRLKKNIKNFGYTPELLLAIRPREWDWKDGSAMVGHAAGFVAQEIEPVMPYAVDGTRNFKALFYDRFHALEISALQDHERRIKALENEVKQKDKEIASLKKRLNMN